MRRSIDVVLGPTIRTERYLESPEDMKRVKALTAHTGSCGTRCVAQRSLDLSVKPVNDDVCRRSSEMPEDKFHRIWKAQRTARSSQTS